MRQRGIKRGPRLARKNPLRSRKGLGPGKPLRPGRKRLRPRNPERAARRFATDFGGQERLDWIHSHPCATCGAPAPSESSHEPTRGAGGKADDQMPQCHRCHTELHHDGPRAFERARGMEPYGLRAITARFAALWRERQERVQLLKNKECSL